MLLNLWQFLVVLIFMTLHFEQSSKDALHCIPQFGFIWLSSLDLKDQSFLSLFKKLKKVLTRKCLNTEKAI